MHFVGVGTSMIRYIQLFNIINWKPAIFYKHIHDFVTILVYNNFLIDDYMFTYLLGG